MRIIQNVKDEMDQMSTEMVQKTVFDITSNQGEVDSVPVTINKSYHLLAVC